MAFRLPTRTLLQVPSRLTPTTLLLPRIQQKRSYASTPSETRTAIVTGSSRGIGKAIALRLARDGYSICVNDIAANEEGCESVVKEIKAQGGNAFYYTADVSKRNEVNDMVAASVSELGPLNTMVANAGIAQVTTLLDLNEADLKKMFEVNVYGVFNCFTAAARQMISQGPPLPSTSTSTQAPTPPPPPPPPYKILAAASIVAFKPFPLLSHYSASKWAVRGMTQAFAMEVAPHNITVNAYAPGIVGTAMWDLIDEKIGEMQGVKKGETIKQYTRDLIALGRTSVPEDVASTVGYLAGRDSDYVTGQTVVVDGGIIFT